MEKLENNCKILNKEPAFKSVTHWGNFAELCEFANENFMLVVDKLRSVAKLNEKEIRLCLLVLLDFSNKQISELLPYAESGLGKLKYSTAKKLNVSTKSLRCYIIHLIIGQKIDCD